MSEESTITKKSTDEIDEIDVDLKTRSLHEFARNGQAEDLKALLEQQKVNVNSLCRTEGLEPLTPLACAVKNGSLRCINLLLDYGAELNLSKRLDKLARKHPLVCALENRNRDVVKFIISKGADMKLAFAILCNLNHPRLYDTLNVKVNLELSEISILEMQETPPNFEALRELLEPEVLCSCDSPIDMALDLEQACLVCASISAEHESTYRQLAKQCQTFAIDFLACCQVASDVELLLSIKNAENTFGLALSYNQKEFLTQPWIQIICAKQWKGEIEDCKNMFYIIGAVIKSFLAPILVPLYILHAMVINNFHHLYKLIQLISSPCLCFLAYVVSNIIFFILLMLMCVQKTPTYPSTAERFAYVWLLGKAFSDFLKYYKVMRLKSFKVSSIRATFDISYILFFGCLFCVRVYTKHASDNCHENLIFAADVFFAIGTMFHSLHLVYVLQVTKFLGPLLVAMKFFLWELLKFTCLLTISILTFSISITKIFYSYDVFSNKDKQAKLSDKFRDFISVSTNLFWSTFGLLNLEDPNLISYRTNVIVDVLLALYILFTSGMLVILLFAMINYQYTKTKKMFQVEWKYLYAKLTHEFSLTHPSIIPLNLVSLPLCILVQTMVRTFGDQSKQGLFGGKDKVVEPHLVYYIQSKIILNPDCHEERQRLIKSLADIYLAKSSWPGISRRVLKNGEAEPDAQSMTSSPTGLVDPTLAIERLSCNLEKQEHAISELKRANRELSLKLDIILNRLGGREREDKTIPTEVHV